MLGLAGAAAAGASVLGTGLSIGEARANREWQERMSNTAYQRAVRDMRLAGLNPMLAFGQGGASTPSGNVADVSDIAKGLTSAGQMAMQARLNKANIDNIDAQTDRTRQETSMLSIEAQRNQTALQRERLGFNIDSTIWQKTGEAKINQILHEQGAAVNAYNQGLLDIKGSEADLEGRKLQADYLRSMSAAIESMVGKGKLADMLKIIIPNLVGKVGGLAYEGAREKIKGDIKSALPHRRTRRNP